MQNTRPTALVSLALGIAAALTALWLAQRAFPAHDESAQTLLFVGLDAPQHGRQRADALLLVQYFARQALLQQLQPGALRLPALASALAWTGFWMPPARRSFSATISTSRKKTTSKLLP